MAHVWVVDCFDLDCLADEKHCDLIEMLVGSQSPLFSTEAKALAHAASLRREFEAELEDESGNPVSLTWNEEHEAPNFFWYTGGPVTWDGIMVRVTRVELDREVEPSGEPSANHQLVRRVP
jgi:hypothetical protein